VAWTCVLVGVSLPYLGPRLLDLHPLAGLLCMAVLLVIGFWVSMRRSARLDRELAQRHETAVRAQPCPVCGALLGETGRVSYLSNFPGLDQTLAKCGPCGAVLVFGKDDRFLGREDAEDDRA